MKFEQTTYVELYTIVESSNGGKITDVINVDNSACYKGYIGTDLVCVFALTVADNIGVIQYMMVLPEHRAKGFGRQMMAKIKEITHAQCCNYITVIADVHMQGFLDKIGGKVCQQVLSQNKAIQLVEYYVPVVEQDWIDLPTAGLVVVKDSKLLLTYSNSKKAWYLPGGKIDEGENTQEALVREIEEELTLVLDESRLEYLTHIVAPAYGEKKNILMQQSCYSYDIREDAIKVANEIGGVHYYTFDEYVAHEIQVAGVLLVFEFLKAKGVLQ